ncbi:MAG: hypothetical protein JWQ90_4111 [Hydrocarboniphaga sp.]|uniref:Rieske (2Fe-2S) protein n=1 Tax=Hydrocarboniphaga sp. TaxID=2033016 RepID=UPI00261AACF0|nr:Rieske 2Fe-2S domain-containing protein [Hydrocarboniphaga sp.]MDB5971661.1 hypothetical protein [Hydrocarboniphaga sp.]
MAKGEHIVGQCSQLQQQRGLAVKIDGVEIALFLENGEVLATAGRCPHANGFLHKGTVCDGKVSCPWHGWTWNLRTGECDETDDLVLPRYEVRVQGDDIYVLLQETASS